MMLMMMMRMEMMMVIMLIMMMMYILGGLERLGGHGGCKLRGHLPQEPAPGAHARVGGHGQAVKGAIVENVFQGMLHLVKGLCVGRTLFRFSF